MMRCEVLISCVFTAVTCPRCAAQGSWEGFTSDIIILVQTDLGIPLTNRPTYYYVVLCRTPLSLLKSFITEIQYTRGVEIQRLQPSVQIVIVSLGEM